MLLFYLLRRRAWRVRADQPSATLDDVAELHRLLAMSGRNGGFVVFLVEDPKSKSFDGWNIQLSAENGTVGLDWVLLTETNIRERERFVQLAQAAGHHVRALSMNGVSYLRVDDGDIVALSTRILTELCNVQREQRLNIVVEGFPWTPSPATSATSRSP
jgi:hypothetical protein